MKTLNCFLFANRYFTGMIETELSKPKSAAKINIPNGPYLEQIISQTIELITKIVGSTLGPNGRPVLIERYDQGLGPVLTKDGVTVAKSLAFADGVKQTILESFREVAISTVNNAGDGTTTATVLANEIYKNLSKFLKKNNQVSPQQAVREIYSFLDSVCVPYIQKKAVKVNNDNHKDLLLTVAKVSTNGDDELSRNVLAAFSMVGDEGHITIAEESGERGYEISKVNGLAIHKGWEESIGRFANSFINDEPNSSIVLEKPGFILVDGNVLDLNGFGRFFQIIEQEYLANKDIPVNYVIFAHQFNANVLAQLAKIQEKSNIKIVPCLTPLDAIANSRLDFLKDVAAFSGGKIFNVISYPVGQGIPSDIGVGAVSFEMNRFKSVIHGAGKEETVIQRVHQLQVRRDSPATSRFEKNILNERIGRLTGGIAKLTVRGPSESQVREAKDRAEDAICAIRGASKQGVLPGGGRILLDLSLLAAGSDSPVVKEVISPSLTKPLLVLLENCGLSGPEMAGVFQDLIEGENLVYNAMSRKFGNPFELQLLDSVPAVLEALRAAVGIASVLGTLGGVVAFARSHEDDTGFSQKNLALKEEMDNYTEPNNSVMLEEV